MVVVKAVLFWKWKWEGEVNLMVCYATFTSVASKGTFWKCAPTPREKGRGNPPLCSGDENLEVSSQKFEAKSAGYFRNCGMDVTPFFPPSSNKDINKVH